MAVSSVRFEVTPILFRPGVRVKAVRPGPPAADAAWYLICGGSRHYNQYDICYRFLPAGGAPELRLPRSRPEAEGSGENAFLR